MCLTAQDEEVENGDVNMVEVKEVAKLRVAARRAESTSSKLQTQLEEMEASLHQLRTQVSE